MAKTLYMVISTSRVVTPSRLSRFRDCGRLAPQGLSYVSSWLDAKLERCYQVMETDDPQLLDDWMAQWRDLVLFEVYPVITSAEAVERIAPRLSLDHG